MGGCCVTNSNIRSNNNNKTPKSEYKLKLKGQCYFYSSVNPTLDYISSTYNDGYQAWNNKLCIIASSEEWISLVHAAYKAYLRTNTLSLSSIEIGFMPDTNKPFIRTKAGLHLAIFSRPGCIYWLDKSHFKDVMANGLMRQQMINQDGDVGDGDGNVDTKKGTTVEVAKPLDINSVEFKSKRLRSKSHGAILKRQVGTSTDHLDEQLAKAAATAVKASDMKSSEKIDELSHTNVYLEHVSYEDSIPFVAKKVIDNIYYALLTNYNVVMLADVP